METLALLLIAREIKFRAWFDVVDVPLSIIVKRHSFREFR
jgi:hypothetical protein